MALGYSRAQRLPAGAASLENAGKQEAWQAQASRDPAPLWFQDLCAEGRTDATPSAQSEVSLSQAFLAACLTIVNVFSSLTPFK